MEIVSIRHSWPEKAGFSLSRPHGAGEYILLHFHNSVRLTYGGRQIATQPGAFVVFSPDLPHSFVSLEPLVHDWMHLRGEVASRMQAFGLETDRLYQPGCGLAITELTARLEAEFFARRTHWQPLSEALMTQLFVTLSRDLSGESTSPVPQETADRLRTLRAELLRHPERGWSNAEMARQVNLSVSRLYPLYRRMFAISPNRDLILIRVEKAKNMLRQGTGVSAAAEQLGYASVYHFIRQFRQVTGVSPGRFKQT